MKKSLFRRIFNLTWLVLAALLTFTACDDDDDDSPDVIVLDGYYIKGAATPLLDFDTDGRFKITQNEVTKEDRSTFYEIYMTVKATDGFNIVKVAGTARTTYGPGADYDVVEGGEYERPVYDYYHGSLIETETMFTVPEDGLYHIAFDTEVNKVIVIPVKKWAAIGSVSSWSDTTMALVGSFNETAMKYQITGLGLRKGELKLRHSGGWKADLDTSLVIADKKGIILNTNFGGTFAVPNPGLEPGGDNYKIALAQEGIYTITMDWTLEDGYVATFTKTEDLPVIDPATFVWSLIGNAFYAADGVTVADWNYDVDFTYDSKVGDVYTYTIDEVELLANGEFKIRRDHDWAVNFGFDSFTIEGDDANFTNSGGNIKVVATKTYSITFDLDWANDLNTITFTEVVK